MSPSTNLKKVFYMAAPYCSAIPGIVVQRAGAAHPGEALPVHLVCNDRGTHSG